MISMIEPIMIIVLGVVIGFIVISIIQPIFQMSITNDLWQFLGPKLSATAS